MLFAALLIPATAAALSSPQLDAAQFQSAIVDAAEPARYFVFFFSPHCGHCKAMEPAWEALESEAVRGSVVQLATVDATEEKEIANKLEVHGYPTLLAFEVGKGASGAVYEYEGERDADALYAFASAAELASSGSGRLRGYMASDGSVRPSLSDILARVPRDAGEIVNFALGTSRAASALLACGLVVLGALLALLALPPPPVPFLIVTCPPHVQPGQTFAVEVTAAAGGGGGRLRRLLLGGGRKARVMTVSAPAGIRPGQEFFVPLVAPPKVRAPADEKKEK